MSVDKSLKEFGKSIRFARIEHNLTQKELAAKLGLTRSQIQKIENGEGNTYIKTIERLLDEFNVPCEVKFIKKLKILKILLKTLEFIVNYNDMLITERRENVFNWSVFKDDGHQHQNTYLV